MSMMTYLEAIEYVLDSEMDARYELIMFRPGARRALEEAERDVPLPKLGAASFSVALGAALTGMHPVLDLRQESEPAALLLDVVCGLPAGLAPAMTVIVSADEVDTLMELPGMQALYPKTPRQAAGFTRSALRSGRMTLLIADQALYGMEDDVPEDSEFMLLPLDGLEETDDLEEAADERSADDSDAAKWENPEDSAENGDAPDCDAGGIPEDVPVCSGAEDDCPDDDECDVADVGGGEAECSADAGCVCEESVCAHDAGCNAADDPMEGAAQSGDAEGLCAPEEESSDCESGAEEVPACEAAPVREERACAACGMRMLPCGLTGLHALAEELGAPPALLIAKCMERVAARHEGFSWQYESEAVPGEYAFLPPDGCAAALWLGCDALTISYDPARMAHAEAAALIREAKRMLEKPALLIYDRERDGQ